MKVTVIGTGYVGLVTGTCFSEFGFNVTCVDKDNDKIQLLKQGVMPIYEPGLEQLVKKNVAADLLSFTTDLPQAVKGANVVFLAVGTPMSTDGRADLTYVFNAVREIASSLSGYTVIVTKSTVPVDTGEKIIKLIREVNPEADFDVVSNPEFLREGSAIEDFMRPDRVVIGSNSERATDIMRQLYRPLYLLETPIVVTSLETAELIKYASNAFLATKVAFINQIADLCEKCGADIQAVSIGMGLDGRIGKKFLHAGPGYGGSCFPKDTLALIRTAEEFSSSLGIVEAVVESNDARKISMIDRIIDACNGSVKDKKIAVLGLTFKPNTDDMRDSPSLVIIPGLQKAGAHIHAYDPEGMKEAKQLMVNVTYGNNAYDVLKDADVAVIITEWNQFRALDLSKVKTLMKTPTIVDLRNIYSPREVASAGINYVSIGRPKVTHTETLELKKNFKSEAA